MQMNCEKKTGLERILLPQMDPEVVANEIEKFILEKILASGYTGAVIGLSGGVDSTTTAALASRAIAKYNRSLARDNFSDDRSLELIGYILPTKTNSSADTTIGESVAERLAIRHELHSIEPVLQAYTATNAEAFDNSYDKGNLSSRVRATVLNTKASTERKILLGTGNRDEDFGIGYYTLFGDGAVHVSPIGGLSKRLVRQMARHLGFVDLADRIPTAGLEPGQTDFGDLGYSYDAVEIVTEGISQGFTREQLYFHPQVVEIADRDIQKYKMEFGKPNHADTRSIVDDITYRQEHSAKTKAELLHPATPKITLIYR
jgi:NAD+ synthase